MFKLLLKTVLSSIFLLGFIIATFYLIFVSLDKFVNNNTGFEIGAGTMSYIQHNLVGKTLSAWDNSLKTMQLNHRDKVTIELINTLHLDKSNKHKLLQGELVLQSTPDQYFLGYDLVEGIMYQRIKNSGYALKLSVGVTLGEVISHTMSPIVDVVSSQLRLHPASQWSFIIKNFQKFYTFPMSVINMNSKVLSDSLKHHLAQDSLVYTFKKDHYFVENVYIKMTDLNAILRIGPINYPWWQINLNRLQLFFFFILTVAIVIVLTWLFSRNVRKIFNLTQHYSCGDFQYKEKFSKLSTLHETSENIISMGESIKTLIRLNQNMIRFVAHEARTPLTTIQLALDAINKSSQTRDGNKVHLHSIKEDVNDLNKLIKSFLLYSQSMTQQLTINKSNTDIISWLEHILHKYLSSTVKFEFNNYLPGTQYRVAVDPKMLRHAFENLLTNAVKHAKFKVIVTLATKNNQLLLSVEDDGETIPSDEKKHLFSAFSTVGTDQYMTDSIGLGLSIAKSIVQLHQGEICVEESKRLSGTMFIIEIPLSS